MKMMKTLLAVSVMAAAVSANAATYNVTGTLTSTTGSAVVVYPVAPAFSGTWDISGGKLNSGQLDFVAYDANVDASAAVGNSPPGTYTAVKSNPHTVEDIVPGTTTVNGLKYSYKGDFNVNPISLAPTCTGSPVICGAAVAQDGDAGTKDDPSGATDADGNPLQVPILDLVNITINFTDATLTSFTGTAKFTDYIQILDASGASVFKGSTVNNYAFSSVPLPAAAWLFGSGLMGLAGVARRRRESV